MAMRGQRFTLDPDADNFTFDVHEDGGGEAINDAAFAVTDIRERESTDAPPPPKFKQTKTGFPTHRTRDNASTFRLRQQQQKNTTPENPKSLSASSLQREPSDRAIANHMIRKYGLDPEAKEKQEISDENQRRIAQMSTEDIEEARSEIMSNFSPAFIERFLKRANIEEDQKASGWGESDGPQPNIEVTESEASRGLNTKMANGSKSSQERKGLGDENVQLSSSVEAQFEQVTPSVHFPVPPRDPKNYVPLDPDSPSFLSELKKHYFPDLPDDPSTLAWLQDPSEDESKTSPYSPTQTRYAPSDIRFGFTGRLIPPSEAKEIPVSKGLHHHGEASESAGYTIPELSILARSVLPNQRCIAYQVLGRILYRLGRGDFGPRGSDLQEGLWTCVEKERPLEVMMSEANRTGGHVSAKTYATEALWLWRKGGGGDRGVLKPSEKIAK